MFFYFTSVFFLVSIPFSVRGLVCFLFFLLFIVSFGYFIVCFLLILSSFIFSSLLSLFITHSSLFLSSFCAYFIILLLYIPFISPSCSFLHTSTVSPLHFYYLSSIPSPYSTQSLFIPFLCLQSLHSSIPPLPPLPLSSSLFLSPHPPPSPLIPLSMVPEGKRGTIREVFFRGSASRNDPHEITIWPAQALIF